MEIFIKAKSDAKVFKADKGNLDLSNGDEIIFEHDQWQEVAMVVASKSIEEEGIRVEEDEVTIIRKLTAKDREKIEELDAEARAAMPKCQEKIEKYGLTMNLVNANLSYDGKKLTFYFVSPGRVDFRALVSDLASTFQKLIRLQQVGTRDKARSVGGCGRCGQELCCRKFLQKDLESVTMDMAYDQNLAQMGSNRVTGACGKLMCCLKYELSFYKDCKKKMPQIGAALKTGDGPGTVVAQNAVKNTVSVQLEDNRIVEVDCSK